MKSPFLLLLLGPLLAACPVDPCADSSLCVSPDSGTVADAGCPVGTATKADGTCLNVGALCGAGMTRDPSGWGCVATTPSCDAGTMATPGEAACTPVGWSTCPAGFTRSGDGWGCDPLLPTAACTGATRAALGSTSCTAVGDCAAPFPPAAATLFVDPAATPDATHFTTIAAALTAASAGATIAIAPGTYRESLTPSRAVKLIGRCPAQVTLIGSPALLVTAVTGVELEGVTIRDSMVALRVEQAGGLTVRHAILEANQRSGAQVLDVGTRVTLQDVVVRGTRADPATNTFGQGIAVSFAGALTLSEVELAGNLETGLFADRADTTVTIDRVVVQNTSPRPSTGRLGWGIGVQRGASLTASNSVIQGNTGSGVLVTVAPSAATLSNVYVRRTSPGIDNANAPQSLNVGVLGGARLTWNGGGSDEGTGSLVHVQDAMSTATLSDLTARTVTPTQGIPPAGITAESEARVTVSRTVVLRAVGSGLAALGGTLNFDHVALLDTTGVAARGQDMGGNLTGTSLVVSGHSDLGIQAANRGLVTVTGCVVRAGVGPKSLGVGVENGVLLLEQCAIDDSGTAGAYARSGGSMILSNTALSNTRLDGAGEFGQGLLVESGANATLTDVSVLGNHSAGLQMADANSSLTGTRVTVQGTQPNGTGTRGRGANANFGGVMTLTSSALVDNQQVGVFAFQSSVSLIDTLISKVKADPGGAYGNGVESLTDGLLVMRGGVIEGCEGIAAVYAEGAGGLDGVRVWRNSIGLHAQDGSTVEELASLPASLLARQVVVTSATVFTENQSKLSATTVPVPPP